MKAGFLKKQKAQSAKLATVSSDVDVANVLAGEWALTASIMQCEGALYGRAHFTDTGEVVYAATSDDLLGRGVGVWEAEGRTVGFDLEVFQYSPMSTKHTQSESHRFRGVGSAPCNSGQWTGDWFFLPLDASPRLVGKFVASRSSTGVPDPTPAPESAKKAVIARLDQKLEPPMMLEPRWTNFLVRDAPADIHYIPDFLGPDQVQTCIDVIESQGNWEKMATRDTQEYGAGSRCPCGRGLLQEALPPWQINVVDALHEVGVFHPVLFPINSVRINSYDPGQGIWPHTDGPVYFPRAAIVTLGSPCVFHFWETYHGDQDETRGFSWDPEKDVPKAPELPPGTKPLVSLILQPGSLLVMSADAFICHRHGIDAVEEDVIGPECRNAAALGYRAGDVLRRGRRVSLTIRHLLPRCPCSA